MVVVQELSLRGHVRGCIFLDEMIQVMDMVVGAFLGSRVFGENALLELLVAVVFIAR